MVKEPSQDAGANLPTTSPGRDRLESLIISLIALKSNIVSVEECHSYLGNDLSTLCDLVIHHLERPEDSQASSQNTPLAEEMSQIAGRVNLNPAPEGFASGCASTELSGGKSSPVLTANEQAGAIDDSFAGDPLQERLEDDYLASKGHACAGSKRPNRLVSTFDRAGDHLINGLDKMGDGIIFLLERIASIGSRNRTQPEDTTT